MKKLSFQICILLIIVNVSLSQAPDLVIELFRHGARAPTSNTYDKTWKSSETGELTALGMRMHYLLGKAVRYEYTQKYGPDFLPTTYNSSLIYARSTDLNRTIMSAYAHLYGLFEGDGLNLTSHVSTELTKPPFNKKLVDDITKSLDSYTAVPYNVLPVPVHVVPYASDSVLAADANCNNRKKWESDNQNTAEFQKMWNSFQSTIEDINSRNFSITDWNTMHKFCDTVICNYYQNKPLPGGIIPNSSLFHNITFMFSWFIAYTSSAQPIQTQTLPVGLYNYLLDQITMVKNGSSQIKLMVLSAGDTTLMSFLTPFKVVTPQCLYQNYLSMNEKGELIDKTCVYPWFGSNIKIEFYNTETPYLLFYYNDNPIKICGNSYECTYTQFSQLIHTVTNGNTMKEYNQNCQNNPSPSSTIFTNIFILNLILFGLLITVIFGLVKSLRKPKKKDIDTEIYSTSSIAYINRSSD